MIRSVMLWRAFWSVVLTTFWLSSALAATDLDSAVRRLADALTGVNEGKIVQVGETGLLYLQFERQSGLAQGHQVEVIRQGDPIKAGDRIAGQREIAIGSARITQLFSGNKALAQMVGTATDLGPQPGDKVIVANQPQTRLVIAPFTYGNQATEFQPRCAG
ncbi:MAG: hypothetical protein HC808_11520 [Candidatus Competibacteraceae bacterium]|nr:hypothetical protein [Candidatus Competibacteraceae bacterium]